MSTSAAPARLVLVAEPRSAASGRRDPRIRRYRLARLADDRRAERFEHLRRCHD